MNQAQDLVQRTFQSDFDHHQFSKFIDRLLKNANFSKKFTQSSFIIRQAYRDKVGSFERIAQFTDVDGNKIDILIVNLKKGSTVERARTSLRNFAADYLQKGRGIGKAAVLVAYAVKGEDGKNVPKTDWRFSYVTLETSLVKDETGKFKIANAHLTPAKRFSFLVGREEKTHTAQKQFLSLLQSQSQPTLKQIEDAFSIERVTKEFYEEYEKLFKRLENEIEALRRRDSALNKHLKENFIKNADFAKKLLGQIVFLYFLQKKGWFGVERGAAWGSGNKNFLRYLFEHRAKLGTRQERGARGESVNFFNDILEHLFYDALARERDEDYYARFDCKIPFLNGGLFEAAYSWSSIDVLLPDALFSNTDTTKEGDKGTGILDVFDRYNFTVNEAEPLEKDVAVDPEMLGKVFENLLPENERKGKGSFYTPRAIVNYMCQQSLVSYLATHLMDVPRADIETFIRIGDFQSDYDAAGTKAHEDDFLPESISRNAARIDELLETITVCDPAIGSGAFPVGMMQEIVRVRGSLTKRLDDMKPNKTASERESFARARSPYELKRHAIQTSLYGVDIDPGAVEIAKLRLWLSLIVDEDERERVQALPNLDYKIMQGNALLDEFAGVKLIDDAVFEKPVIDIEAERHAIQERINELTQQLYVLHGKGGEARELKRKFGKETDRLKKQSKALAQGTAVAENISLLPDDPYREARLTHDEMRRKIDEFFSLTSPREKREAREQIEKLEWRFMEQTLKARGEEGALKALALHRRDNRKPYFLWKLYFSDVFQGKGGFDVVIGNPPYVRADSGEEHLEMRKAIGQSKSYETLWEKWDLYVAMIERGYKLLKPHGVISFIVSDAYSHSKYAQKSQKWFLQNSRVLRLDFLGKIQIFEAAVRNILFFFQKADGATHEPERRVHEEEFGKVTLLPTAPQKELTYRAFFPEDVETRKYDVPTVSLRDVCYISKGMVVHADEKVAHGEFELSDLVSDKKDRLHPKPFVEGKHLARWLPTMNKWLEWNTERAPALFSRPTFKEMYEVSEKLISVDMSAGISQLRVAYDNKKLYHNHSAWSFIRWRDLSGVRNNSLKKVARYDDEKPPRPDLPRREELEKVSQRFNVKFLLGVMNSTLANNFLRAHRRSNIHLYPDDWKNLPIAEATPEQQTIIATFVDHTLFLKEFRVTSLDVSSSDAANFTPEGVTLNVGYFEQIIDALVYELYLTDELHTANLHFFRPLAAERMPSLRDHKGDERRIIQTIFERLSAHDHEIRRNLYVLGELESVRIIEGKA